MAAPPHNHPQHRGQIEVGMHVVDLFPNETPPIPNNSNHQTRPTRWLQQPKNLALFLWLIPVASCLLMQLLLLTGALDRATKTKERKKIWNEVDNQILNALFTLGCFLTHPKLFYQLLLVIRWRPEDEISVRTTYCPRNRTPKPRDRCHLLFVVCLLNLTWVGQYVMCGLYWGFNRHNRPSGFLNLLLVVTLVAPIVAFSYVARGPLKADTMEPVPTEIKLRKMYNGGVMIARPEWDGEIFSNSSFFFFCPFYAFGKNMNKLGLGSRNLHTVTFVIAVVAPFLIFYITSLKVHSHAIKVMLWITGGLISWVGLLYGGYWRVRMREMYNLPENPFCFGVPFLTDYFQWLFCAPCSLAQEIRTANSYDIIEE